MAGFDYNRPIKTADRLIKRFGQSMTVHKKTNSGTAYNPIVTVDDHIFSGAVMEYNNFDIDGTLIKRGDKMVYLSAKGITAKPEKSDAITIGDVRHEIVNVDTLAPAGVDVYYEVQIRV